MLRLFQKKSKVLNKLNKTSKHYEFKYDMAMKILDELSGRVYLNLIFNL